ncbi:unnamed protein product [Vicia faba]|uniref:Uncharacterized protein n=1 Tax=Vicia faba TaxID=3906 RepID=A0AAV0ZK74_VICFA|nr:unnamed protein product [Vicia faba]
MLPSSSMSSLSRPSEPPDMKNMSKITQDEEKLVQCNETCVKDDNNNEDPWLAKVGTLVEAQSACLNLLGVKGAMPSKESPGANSRQLATIENTESKPSILPSIYAFEGYSNRTNSL